MGNTDRTERELVTTYAMGSTATIVRKLRELADRIERRGSAFPKTRQPITLAADIVSEFTDGTGNMSSHLWNLIRDAEELAKELAKETRTQDNTDGTS
jgi:methyl-accepting chemotaxis protein